MKALGLPGVFVAEDFKRDYPKGNFLAHVLGFAGIDNQGLTGLESYYNEGLEGKDGHVAFFSDVNGNRMSDLKDEYIPPKSGESLMLTVDSRVQSIMERELNNAVAAYHPDSALAIAMDPNTGAILGMSSKPDYNPENYKTVSPDVYNHNLPIWKTYEPGSTFKVITLSAALQEKAVDLKKIIFMIQALLRLAGHIFTVGRKAGMAPNHFWKSFRIPATLVLSPWANESERTNCSLILINSASASKLGLIFKAKRKESCSTKIRSDRLKQQRQRSVKGFRLHRFSKLPRYPLQSTAAISISRN
ncbi:cell division protein FtsI [Sporolactobacillus inulinus]|uniref:Cell division protein FtsI n=1 Tax=Sporolactobacillus inulinus TaxID=2078 RepID=A0A4Y1ZBR6_9BACL|nr:cell division protein FtsI [Sporolactobacillus inulinus]